MLLIQIFIVLFALFMLARTWKQFRAGRLRKRELGFWLLFWIVLGVAAVLPETTEVAAHLVGVGRGVDLAIYLALIALFYLVFRLYVKIEDVERDMTKLVRKIALDQDKKSD